MPRSYFSPWFLLAGLMLMGSFSSCASVPEQAKWRRLENVPDPEGFASAYAGVSHDALLIAGGANFPDKRPWEGGTKKWYDGVFALSSPEARWVRVGKLPRPLAYGVSVSIDQAMVCVGGGDAQEHVRDVFTVSWDGRNLVTTTLPPLPATCAFASGCLVGRTLFIAGGLEKPDATTAMSTFWKMDFSQQPLRWESLPTWPGAPRMLAMVGASGNRFYLVGGVALHAGADGKAARTYLDDVFSYDEKNGWTTLRKMPHALAAAPSPLPINGAGQLMAISGDDGTRVQLTGPDHPGFKPEVLLYDPVKNSWAATADAPISRATAPTVYWRGRWIIANGERKPGYRTAEIWSLQLDP